ncbi:MAG: flagellar P-ring protein precursor FlgI [Pirellulaceae bacterium]|jgi:flagellar P-ring protein precursor FlgI
MLRKLFIIVSLVFICPAVVSADFRLRDICRFSGQQKSTLHGLGIVTGLNGTGDNSVKPTMRALARMMHLAGNPIPDQDLVTELKDAKNVALVTISVTIPAQGARAGDTMDCVVNAITAKSIAGGTLWPTPLISDQPGDPYVYGFAQGTLKLPDAKQGTVAKIHAGCQLREDFVNPFHRNGVMELILHKDHAGFHNTQEIEDLLNNQTDFSIGRSSKEPIARAIDQVTVRVSVPDKYKDSEVLFAYLVMNTKVYTAQTDARVVIREKEGVILIGQNVTIGPVAITHKNLVIDAGGGQEFVGLDPSGSDETVRLKALIESLKALQVPTADMIEIIKGLKTSGDLYAQLIIE